jgi:hypothetical protein
VLDKILHNEYDVSLDVLNRANVFPIFLVRKPSPTISSILEMGRDIHVPWYSDRDAVTRYYEQRLAALGKLGGGIDDPGLAIHAESVINRTETVLKAVANFLGLAHPPTEFYRIFKHTGEVGWGDSSSAIGTGRIVREQWTTARAEIEPQALARARATYAECLEALSQRCEIV